MGALTRATRAEIADDQSWLPDFLVLVAEKGSVAVKEWCEERMWAKGEFWNFIRGDERVKNAYQEALKFRSEIAVGETLAISDSADDPKLAVDTRFRLAEKWFPEIYRARGQNEAPGAQLTDALLLTAAVELLAKVRESPQIRTIEHEPAEEI